MFRDIDKSVRDKLWKHQEDALTFAVNHLNARDGVCLVRMPTGTGKTGVIACLTQVANTGTSLVVTPWVTLREQMVGDLNKQFWEKIGSHAAKRPKAVPMLPKSAKEVLKTGDPQVIVTTFASLNSLRLNYHSIYEALAKAVSLVVVDECHYEPAVEWGKSVKGLRAKTVLLTATPYRNDLKLFQIKDPGNSTWHFTHKQAVEKQIVRDLEFEDLACAPDIPKLAAAFAARWKALRRARLLPSANPRAIVCCAHHLDIQAAVDALRKAGLKAVGVHERFVPPTATLLKDVPKEIKTHTAEVWVHQHKLTEGLDDHRFCLLALFTHIRNDRKLIQQFGRVLRRTDGDVARPALCLAPREYSAQDEWNAYRAFETNLELLNPQHFRDVVDTLLRRQPDVEYFDGRFRRRFDHTVLATKPQVIIPPSVLVRCARPTFSLHAYVQDCTDTLNTEDAVILGPDINGPCKKGTDFALWIYACVRNSRYLQDTSLYEISLETHCVVVADGFVFVADTRGHKPEEYLEEHTTRVPPQALHRYLDQRFRPTHVSLSSAVPYDTVVRGAQIRGHNLLGIAASLTDRMQICRSATGRAKNVGRRHIGMTNGRVRDEVPDEKRHTFATAIFVAWAGEVAKVLKSATPGSALFGRYMPTCAPPPNPEPKVLCLDLLRDDLTFQLADGAECQLKHSSCIIAQQTVNAATIHTGSFELENGGTVELRITFDRAKARFWFTKAGGTAVRAFLASDDKGVVKSLAEFLNQEQDSVLIGLSDGQIVYQGRNFYKVDYEHAEKLLVDLIQRPAQAPVCATEKGTKAQIKVSKKARAKSFPKGSLFRAVADRKIGLPFDEELLICDDMGSECADFVAINFKKHQLALIHAKTGPGGGISAAAFHDVAAQAMKNMVYLTKNSEVPKGVAHWKAGAKWNGTGVSRLCGTVGKLPAGEMLWRKIKDEIVGSSNPELYVVLVTAGCCDLRALKMAVAPGGHRTPELAQLVHLLDGLNGYARQLGVRVLIRDLPLA